MASINFKGMAAAAKQTKAAEPAEFTPGTYLMAVTYVKPTFSRNANFMYVIGFESLEGDTKGRQVKYHVTLNESNPTSVNLFLDRLNDFGIDDDYLGTGPDENEVAQKIAQAGDMLVSIKHRAFENRLVPDVYRVRKANA